MFRVRLTRTARRELTDIWLAVPIAARDVIMRAYDDVAARLGRDPMNEGESRSRGRRITFEHPLSVVFRVESDGNNVTILHVHHIRRRTP
jgi:plasmid stabilization system protein ParE